MFGKERARWFSPLIIGETTAKWRDSVRGQVKVKGSIQERATPLTHTCYYHLAITAGHDDQYETIMSVELPHMYILGL